jgi:magnesium transporter
MSEIQKIRARLKKIGLPPGVLLWREEMRNTAVSVSVIDYDAQTFSEKSVSKIEDCSVYKNSPTITWINVDGSHSPDIVGKLGEQFGIHPLVLEDVMTSGQRPKFEDYGDYLVIILKMIYPGKKKNEIVDEQLSLIVGSNYVISFQESPGGDPFDSIRDRIRNSLGKIRKSKSDFLAYSLMDVIVDNYFVILEKIGEEIETIEESTVKAPVPASLKKTYDLKRTLIFFRKFVWPLREVMAFLNRSDSAIVDPATQVYFRDIYDHIIQLIDSIETYRDIASTIVDIYLSNVSNKTNETVKRLTTVATICMPLSIVAGIGGMSEWSMMTGSANWMISYPLFILGLCALGFGTYLFFKWRRWL